MVFKKLLVVGAVFALSGCSTVNRAIQWGAAANDTALESAQRTQCEIASVRSVNEKFNTQELRRAYNLMCGNVLYISP